MMTAQPIVELKDIVRQFTNGEETLTVLRKINLSIYSGEMIAIVGASGSGKSTLMNILGCLDKPSSGDYIIAGRSTSKLNPDELAELRREYFGFIFQRYHLLSGLTAIGNVEIPAIYAGIAHDKRQERAGQLLTQLGLGERIDYRPNQLSGGQQQRVSIARALMNGGKIILADEPTGALDQHSGQEVLKILRDLHKQGHTVIIVTHDMQIAQHAERIIEINDGNIIDDRIVSRDTISPKPHEIAPVTAFHSKTINTWRTFFDRFGDAFKMALLAMSAQRLRTLLTMLGIIIGIAAVVSVVALGQGAQQKIYKDISAMGTSTLTVFPGRGFGDRRASYITTLRASDAVALSQQPYVHSVTPVVTESSTFQIGNKALSGTIYGVGEQYFAVKSYTITQGMGFNDNSIQSLGQDVVIDDKTREKLFGENVDPLGQVILLGSLPVRVIGVVTDSSSRVDRSETLKVWLPYTTVLYKILGQTYLQNIIVRVNDDVDIDVAEKSVEELILQRHGTKDFSIFNSDSIRQTITSTTTTMTIVISSIAVISLIVGGIGVMNIMLVSVTERTREIGIRMAVGARSSDIMQQFLIEAVLVCLLGGTLGIILSFLIGVLVNYTPIPFTPVYTLTPVVLAFICSTIIGIVFGFFPAYRASKMEPIHALERE